jgi:excisionase family DNA binding protein
MIKTEKTATAERAADWLLTKEELAPHLRIGHRTVDDWMRRGIIPFLKIGKAVRFRLPDVLESLSRFRVN